MEAAGAGAGSPSDPTDVAIVIGPAGTIRITEASGWDLAALQADSGARTVYRVSRNPAGVRVEGRSGTRSCVFTAEPSVLRARRLLNAAAPGGCSAGDGQPLRPGRLLLQPRAGDSTTW
jgi:hypothetical protein